MGTKGQAAKKQPKDRLNNPDPELQRIMEQMASKVVRPDGSLDAIAVLSGVKGILGPERYGAFEDELADYFAPVGVVEVFTSTWDYGWEGKLHTVCGIIGAAAVLVGVCEVAGRLLEVPGLCFATKLSQMILGD